MYRKSNNPLFLSKSLNLYLKTFLAIDNIIDINQDDIILYNKIAYDLQIYIFIKYILKIVRSTNNKIIYIRLILNNKVYNKNKIYEMNV